MADSLTVTSRNFFERTKAKLVASLVVGSASLMLLGFCSYSGGTAANFQSGVSRRSGWGVKVCTRNCPKLIFPSLSLSQKQTAAHVLQEG